MPVETVQQNAVPNTMDIGSRGTTPPNSSPRGISVNGTSSGGSLGNTVKWLASQIPEFGATEDENVQAWVKKVDKVAQIHG